MGYYSSGAIRITGPKERMLAELASLSLLGDENMRDALKEFTLMADGEKDAVLGLDYEDWKWYPDYKDIQAFEKVWGRFEDLWNESSEALFNGSFIRIGEDNEDIEQRHFGDSAPELIQLCRSFVCDHTLDRTKDLRNNRSSFNEPKTGTA